MRYWILRLVPVVLVALLNTGLSSAITYNVTDLDTLPGDASSIAYSINDSGQIVGTSGTFYQGEIFDGRAFLYQTGSMLPLSGPNSTANGINDDGDVVGSAYGDAGVSAFLYNGATTKDIGALLSSGGSFATAVNAGGQVVGYRSYQVGEGAVQDAFLYSAGTAVEFHSLGLSNGSIAYGINAAGEVVGSGLSDVLARSSSGIEGADFVRDFRYGSTFLLADRRRG
jgi:probable HAF family extracellular repeat protein